MLLSLSGVSVGVAAPVDGKDGVVVATSKVTGDDVTSGGSNDTTVILGTQVLWMNCWLEIRVDSFFPFPFFDDFFILPFLPFPSVFW